MEETQKQNMSYNANYRLFQFAVKNRKQPTEAEALLWERLKNKQLKGAKFRRQHPIGNFILDFYCHAAKLGLELDGAYHANHYKKNMIR